VPIGKFSPKYCGRLRRNAAPTLHCGGVAINREGPPSPRHRHFHDSESRLRVRKSTQRTNARIQPHVGRVRTASEATGWAERSNALEWVTDAAFRFSRRSDELFATSCIPSIFDQQGVSGGDRRVPRDMLIWLHHENILPLGRRVRSGRQVPASPGGDACRNHPDSRFTAEEFQVLDRATC